MRRFTLLLAICLFFAACGGRQPESGSETATGNQTLELALFRGGFGEEYWKAVIAAFSKEHPNVTINYKIHPNIGDLIKPALLSGEFPDFLYHSDSTADGVVASLIQSNALTDLTEIFDGNAYQSDESLRSQFLPGILETPRYSPYNDSRIYLAPFSYGPLGLVYNQTLFEKNGWDIPRTWEDFFDLGELAKAQGIALMTYPGLYPGYLESLVFPAIANSAGMQSLEQLFNLNEEVLDDPAVLSALKMIQSICTEGYLLDGSFEMNHLQSQAAALMDKALFIPNGIWIQNEMYSYPHTEGFQFALAAVPVFSEDATHYVQISYEQLSIPRNAKNPELAKEFLRYLYCDESVKIFAEKANGVFALSRALELEKPYMEATVYNMYSILEDNRVVAYMPAFVNTPSAETARDLILVSYARQVLQYSQPVELWVDSMKQQMQKLRDIS